MGASVLDRRRLRCSVESMEIGEGLCPFGRIICEAPFLYDKCIFNFSGEGDLKGVAFGCGTCIGGSEVNVAMGVLGVG